MNWEKGRQLESMTDGTDTLSFRYDNGGIRTSKTVNGIQTKYTYIGTTLVSQKTGNEILNFAYSAGGAPYGFTYNGTSYFYLLNIQGDIIGIYDGNGNVVVDYTYDSWGKLVSITGSLAETVGVKNPLRYRGYYYDTETSLYYLQSRYYDPDTCRFINADSLLVAGDYVQGTNMFAYCINNPVMYVDPSGHEPGIEEALYSILGTIFGLMYLVEILPIEQIEVFMKSVADAGSTSGTIVADAVLGLCEIVSGNYNGKLDEGGIFDYTYSWYREENIYHLSIEGEEAYIFKNDYNSSSIDDFVQNTNTLSGVVIATITTALVGAGSLAIGAICSGVGIVSVGLGSLTVTTSAFLKTGITVLGSTLISSIYNVFSKENLDYLFSVIVDGKTS